MEFETQNANINKFFDYLVENAYVKGDFRQDFPKDFIKRLIAYMFTHIHEITGITSVDDYEAVADNLIEFLKNGLAAKI
ncbi:MAG: hypothetical protein ACOYWZ_10760 [Bacillota bacterium]